MDWQEGIHSHIQLAITSMCSCMKLLPIPLFYIQNFIMFQSIITSFFPQTVIVCNMLLWKGSLPDSGYSFTASHHKNKREKKKGGVLEIQAYKIQGHRSSISFSLITGLHLHFTSTSHFPRNKALEELAIFTH